jgi:hypothetical protein
MHLRAPRHVGTLLYSTTMDRLESARITFVIALVLSLLMLPLHWFVAPHLRIVNMLCIIGWLFVGTLVVSALNDLRMAWWKRSVVADYRRQLGGDFTVRPFALLLRSTQCDKRLRMDREVRGIEDSIMGPIEVVRRLPGTVQQLEQALRPLPLKRVKHPEHADDVPTVQYADVSWRAEIVKDFEQAEAILVIPLWLSEPVLWEIQTVLSMGLVEKLFFVMPAMEDAPPNVSTDWFTCKQRLRDLNIELKGYMRSGGMLYRRKVLTFSLVLPLNVLSQEKLRLAMDPASARPLRYRL